MKDVQAAIDRIVKGHYGGSWNSRQAATFGKRLYNKPPVQDKQVNVFRNWLSRRMLSGQ